MALAFEWDSNALEFQSVGFGGNPMGLSSANFNPNKPGELLMSWFDPNVVGINLADSTAIFILNLRIKNATPAFYPVHMAAKFNEIVMEDVFIGNIPIAYETGGVYVNMAMQPRLLTDGFCMRIATDCNDGSGSIDFNISGGSGSYLFSWTGPGGFSSGAQNLSGLAAGYYRLTVTDQIGSSAEAAVKISGAEPLLLSASITPTSCAQNNACIYLGIQSGQPPFSIAWSTGDSTQSLCGLGPGAYAVTVSDANGCTRSDSFTVTAVNTLPVSAFSTPANCASGQAGTAAALPQNGVAPFRYEWSTGDTLPVIVGLYTGAYTVTVTDAGGCSGVATTAIGDAAVSAWGLGLIPQCPSPNQPAGHLLLSAADPSTMRFPLTVHWSSGSSSAVAAPAGDTIATLSFLPSGLYKVTVTDSIGCAQQLETALNCLLDFPADSAIFIWPGDADHNRAVNHHDLLYLGLGFAQSGPPRPNATLDWVGQAAPDWPQSTPQRAVNFRHLDADGNGVINAADTLAIVANWGRVIHPLTDDPFGIPKSVPGIANTPAPALSFDADTLFAGQTAPIPVVLGATGAPAGNMHGLSFSVSYDPHILYPLYFEPLPSWFGDPAGGMLCVQRHFPGQHRIDVALTRTDGIPANGFGIIGRMFIVIEDDIFLRKPIDQPDDLSGGGDDDAVVVTQLFLRRVQGLSPENTQPEIAPVVSPVVIRKTVHTAGPVAEAPAVAVWPNPVREVLHIAAENERLLSVQVFDLTGRPVFRLDGLSAPAIDLPAGHWTPGFYTVWVQTERGRYQQTIIRL